MESLNKTEEIIGLFMWQASALRAEEKLECCVVVPTTPSYEMWSGIARHLGRYMTAKLPQNTQKIL